MPLCTLSHMVQMMPAEPSGSDCLPMHLHIHADTHSMLIVLGFMYFFSSITCSRRYLLCGPRCRRKTRLSRLACLSVLAVTFGTLSGIHYSVQRWLLYLSEMTYGGTREHHILPLETQRRVRGLDGEEGGR